MICQPAERRQRVAGGLGAEEGGMSRTIIRFRVDLGAELGIGPGKIALLRSVRTVRCQKPHALWA
jgi:hypothetical protein